MKASCGGPRWWHGFRIRVGTRLLPACTRGLLLEGMRRALVQDAMPDLAKALADDDTASFDQQLAPLRDFGIGVKVVDLGGDDSER